MIQRIQSVYLLVVTILLIVCMCTPVGAYIAEDYSVSKFTNLCIVSADGVKDYAPWAMFVILVVAALLSFTTIFMNCFCVSTSTFLTDNPAEANALTTI